MILDIVKLVMPLLGEIKFGHRLSWRHDVMVGKQVLLNGKRIMKHDLMHFNCNEIGDFTDEAREIIFSKVQVFNPDDFDYNTKVLVPTMLHWIVMILAKLSGPKALFYLLNGGKT